MAEQGELFPKTVGTGLHTDPSNRMYRRKLINSMVRANPEHPGRDRGIASSLNTSRIPLQHLGDVRSNGTFSFSADLSGIGASGIFMASESSGGELPNRIAIHRGQERQRFVVSHEFGHAYHDHMSKQFSNTPGGITANVDGDIGTVEGIADGYADRYSGEKRTDHKGYGRNMLFYGGFKQYGPYLRNRENTGQTGVVPHLAEDRTDNSYDPDSEGTQEKLF